MIAHAIIEDTFLFVIFGANAWVVISIRLLMAFIFSFILVKIYKNTHYTNVKISDSP
jgi:hypothetical protein